MLGVGVGTAYRARLWFDPDKGAQWKLIAEDVLSFGALAMITLGVCQVFSLRDYAAGLVGVGATIVGLDALRGIFALGIERFVKSNTPVNDGTGAVLSGGSANVDDPDGGDAR